MELLNVHSNEGALTAELRADDGKARTVELSTVRGGLSWPGPESPGYFVIVAAERQTETRFEGHPKPQTRLHFVTEGEVKGLLLEPLFERMTDAAVKYFASEFYAPIEEDREETARFYDGWRWERGIRYGRLVPAPFANDPSLGVSLISKALNSELLDLPPDSILRRQLQGLAAQDLCDLNDASFYAVNAARHLFSGFRKYAPSNLRGPFIPNRS